MKGASRAQSIVECWLWVVSSCGWFDSAAGVSGRISERRACDVRRQPGDKFDGLLFAVEIKGGGSWEEVKASSLRDEMSHKLSADEVTYQPDQRLLFIHIQEPVCRADLFWTFIVCDPCHRRAGICISRISVQDNRFDIR